MRDKGAPPTGWSALRLADLISFPQGQVDPKRDPYSEWPLIAPDHIEQRTGVLLSVQTAQQQGAISGKYPFMPGDVLYSKIRPYLRKAVLADREGLCSADMYPLRARQGIVPRFLLALLLGEDFSHFAEAVSVRSGFPKINRAEFGEYFAHVPPVAEQSDIAAILNALDDAIHRTEQIVAKLRQMKQGLLHDLLTRGVDKHGDLRPQPSEAPHLYKDSPLGRIPKAWEPTELGSLLAVVYRYPTYYGIQYVTEGIREIRGELIRSDGSLEPDSSAYRCITPMTAARFPRVRLEPSDFVMSVRGTVGKVAQVPEWLAGSVITANLIRLGFNRNRVDAGWMKDFLLSRIFQDALVLGCSATTIKTIQVPALSSILLRLPGKEEQATIARRVEELETKIRCESDWAKKFHSVSAGLHHDLLTGRLRVPPPIEAMV